MEFINLEPLLENDTRRERLQRDREAQSKFVGFGDELWALRSEMEELSLRLVDAITNGQTETEERTRARLQEIERKDPELVYMLELADLKDALSAGRTEDARKHEQRAKAARSILPQFNLDGLWVGKYGSHGYELINITYVGDVLIATKVTGDKNVPRGEISFQVDLDPLKASIATPFQDYEKEHGMKTLKPIKLTETAARKWGTSQLPRYAGLGQVAESGFYNRQWMDGQLIIIGQDYFSFAWLPIEQQIFFGRPSPQLALKMLSDNGAASIRVPTTFAKAPSVDDDIEVQRRFAMRCLDLTHEYEDEVLVNVDHPSIPLSCIWEGHDECHFE